MNGRRRAAAADPYRNWNVYFEDGHMRVIYDTSADVRKHGAFYVPTHGPILRVEQSPPLAVR